MKRPRYILGTERTAARSVARTAGFAQARSSRRGGPRRCPTETQMTAVIPPGC